MARTMSFTPGYEVEFIIPASAQPELTPERNTDQRDDAAYFSRAPTLEQMQLPDAPIIPRVKLTVGNNLDTYLALLPDAIEYEIELPFSLQEFRAMRVKSERMHGRILAALGMYADEMDSRSYTFANTLIYDLGKICEPIVISILNERDADMYGGEFLAQYLD